MVKSHRVIGGDGTVNEGPARLALVQVAQFLEGLRVFPELQQLALLGGKIYFWFTSLTWNLLNSNPDRVLVINR